MSRRMLLVSTATLAAIALTVVFGLRTLPTEDASGPLVERLSNPTSQSAVGREGRDVDAAEAATPESVALQGRAGSAIRLRVVDEEGRAVPSARASVFGAGPRIPSRETYPVVNGEAWIPRDRMPSPYALWVRRSDDESIWFSHSGQVEGTVDDDTREIRVVLPGVRWIRGTVLGPDGSPVAGVDVSLGSLEAYDASVTGAEGRFRLRAPAGKVARLLAKAPSKSLLDAVVEVPVEQAEVEIRLAPSVPFALRVVGPDGKAVAGLRLRLEGAAPAFARTDEEGIARFYDVSADHPVEIATIPEVGGPDVPAVTRTVLASKDLVRLAVPVGAALRGTVTDEDGAPVAWGTVTVRGVDGSSTPVRAPIQHGRFHARRLRPGPYLLEATGPPELGPLEPRRVTAPATDVRLVLPPGRAVTGRVAGERPWDVRVQWFGQHGTVRTVTPEDDGSIALRGLGDAAGSLFAWRPGTDECVMLEDVVPPVEGLSLRLGLGVRLEVQVVTEGGAERSSIDGDHLTCVRGPIRLPSGWSAFGGGRIRALPPGLWRLEYRPAGRDVPVVEDVSTSAGEVVLRVP